MISTLLLWFLLNQTPANAAQEWVPPAKNNIKIEQTSDYYREKTFKVLEENRLRKEGLSNNSDKIIASIITPDIESYLDSNDVIESAELRLANNLPRSPYKERIIPSYNKFVNILKPETKRVRTKFKSEIEAIINGYYEATDKFLGGDENSCVEKAFIIETLNNIIGREYDGQENRFYISGLALVLNSENDAGLVVLNPHDGDEYYVMAPLIKGGRLLGLDKYFVSRLEKTPKEGPYLRPLSPEEVLGIALFNKAVGQFYDGSLIEAIKSVEEASSLFPEWDVPKRAKEYFLEYNNNQLF